MQCALCRPADRLTIGKRYDILDMDPVAIGPEEALFSYYIANDDGDFIWVTSEYMENFIPRNTR